MKSVKLSVSSVSLDREVFRGCTGLEKADIGGAVKLGSKLFMDCSDLASISIGGSTDIGESMFLGCTGLKTAVLSGDIPLIGAHAFEGCTALESITMPSSTAKIGESAFSGCTKLLSLELPEGLRSIEDRAFEGVLMERLVIGKEVGWIGSGAFSNCTALKTIVLPEGLKAINPHLFENCNALESVNVPSTVEKIGDQAFSGCAKLASIELPNAVTGIGAHAFENCTALGSMSLGSKVRSIGEGAFMNCTALKKADLPSGLVAIGPYVFQNCTALESISIPSGTEEIGEYAFAGCSELKSIKLPKYLRTVGDHAFHGAATAGGINLIFGYETESLGTSAFEGMLGLESVTFKSSAVEMDGTCFKGCTGIKEISVPIDMSLALKGGKAVFESLASLQSISFTTGSGKGVDYTQSGIRAVWATLSGEKVSVDLGEGIQYIGNYMFSGFRGMTEITIPDYVSAIGKHTFDGCPDLAKATLGYSVSEVGDGAFAGCIGLKDIVNKSLLTLKSGDDSYGGVAKYAKTIDQTTGRTTVDGYDIVYNPTANDCLVISYDGELKGAFKLPEKFDIDGKAYANIKIGNAAFSQSDNLTEICIGDSCSSVGSCAFQVREGSRISLERITVEGAGTFIGNGAFDGIKDVKRINLDDGITMSADAFDDSLGFYLDGHRMYGDDISGYKWMLSGNGKYYPTLTDDEGDAEDDSIDAESESGFPTTVAVAAIAGVVIVILALALVIGRRRA